MADPSKAMALFGSGALEAPSQQAAELAETRHYEAMSRLDTLMAVARDSISGIIELHLEGNKYKSFLSRTTREEIAALEVEVYQNARAAIRHLRYDDERR